jgi:hypothetical protein
MTNESKRDVRNGVVDATLRQVEDMLAAHRVEMRELVDRIGEVTLLDHFAELALRVLPPEVLVGTSEEIANRVYDLAAAMVRRRKLVDETRDTERPPAFTPEEPDTFAPVAAPVGPMVGPGRDDEEKLRALLDAVKRMTPQQRAEFVQTACGIHADVVSRMWNGESPAGDAS